MNPPAEKKSFVEQATRLFQGQVIFAGSQWLLLALISYFGDGVASGNYVFALSVTAPIFLLFDLSLRVVRSTDHRHNEDYSTYWAIRFYGLLAAVLTTVLVAGVFFPDRLLLIFAISFFRIGDSVSNLAFGGLQRAQRTDLIGRSLTSKGLTVIFLVAFVAWLSAGDAFFVAIAMSLISLGWASLFDFPQAWRMNSESPFRFSLPLRALTDFTSLKRIASRAFPLGLDGFISSLAINSPKYCIEYFCGTKALGIFGIVFQLAFAMQMLIGALGHTGVSVLADAYEKNMRTKFWSLVKKMVAGSAAIGVLFVLVGSVTIPPLMGQFLGADHNQPMMTFLLLVGSTLAGLQRIIGRATQACGQYFWYMTFDFVIFLGSMTASITLTGLFGIVGGSGGLLIGFAIGLVTTVLHTSKFLWPDNTSTAPTS